MVRTQIQFSDSQLEALRKLSAESGRSVAELTRQAVDLYLEQQRGTNRAVLVERALAVTGKFTSGLQDVSTNHDRYLAEAFHP